MSIQTGWYITDNGSTPTSTGIFTVTGDGVLRVQGQKSYRFSNVFPQFSTKQSVFEEFLKPNLESISINGSSCTVVCGERSESQRLEMLFGKVPLSDKRASYSDGLMMRTYLELPALGADSNVRFSLACLKEKGAHAVDLLKNLSNSSSTGSIASTSSHLSEAPITTSLNCKLMSVNSISSFTSLLNRVLQSPSFIRLSQSLSLLLTFSFFVNGKEATVSVLDICSHHMDAYNLLSLVPQIRNSVIATSAVPDFLQLSLRDASQVGVLVMHPNTMSAGLTSYLEDLSRCGSTAGDHINPVSSPITRPSPSRSRTSPERKWISPNSPGSPVKSEYNNVASISIQRARGRLAGTSAAAINHDAGYSNTATLSYSERENYEREIERLTRQLREQAHRSEQLSHRTIEEVEGRITTRELQLTKAHEIQLTTERNAHRRALADMEQEFMLKESDYERQVSQQQENIRSLNTQLEIKTTEIERIKSTIPDVRREEAARLNEDWERSMVETDQDIQKLQKGLKDHSLALEASEQENEELRQALRGAQETLENFKLKTIEDRSQLETEVETERSAIRAELSIAQADSLKASRLLEAKELEVQGLTRLAHEMEEIRSRNGELERLLRESQHYNRTQQLKREMDTCNEILEALRLIMVPTWCPDWQRLGRLKDLKEHLLARGDEMCQKVRESETLERNQRVREVALVGEHENAIAKMTEQSRRAALLEARSSEVEQEMHALRNENASCKSELVELRRIVESISVILMEPSPGLSENWAPSAEVESWLVNTLRSVRSERDRFRDSDVDKSHMLQELQVKYAQLQAENDSVNQNIKEMTNQIIGCQLEPLEDHTSVIRSPPAARELTAADVIPPPIDVHQTAAGAPVAAMGTYPSTSTVVGSRPLLMMSPSVPQASKPRPLIHPAGVLPAPIIQATPRHTTPRHTFPTSPAVPSALR